MDRILTKLNVFRVPTGTPFRMIPTFDMDVTVAILFMNVFRTTLPTEFWQAPKQLEYVRKQLMDRTVLH